MATKPKITVGDDNRTPTMAVQQADGEWALPTASSDGYHVTIGAKADAEAGSDLAQGWSVVSLLKGLLAKLRGTVNVAVTERISTAPVVGAKTVTTTAAELFAGGARLANRIAMVVYNESSIPVYWGPAGVTTSNGFPLLPGDSVTFQFRSSVAVPIYFVASGNAVVRVVEVA